MRWQTKSGNNEFIFPENSLSLTNSYLTLLGELVSQQTFTQNQENNTSTYVPGIQVFTPEGISTSCKYSPHF